MKTRRNRFFYGRKARGGTSIAEFGPAMWILFICFFFPLLNMLGMAVSYGLCMVLNFNQVHEAALIERTAAEDPNGPIIKGIPDQWQGGMGRFVKMAGPPGTELFYRDGTNNDKIVTVKTTLVCNPFLPIPLWILNVPGLNGPMTFVMFSEQTMENPDYGQAGAGS